MKPLTPEQREHAARLFGYAVKTAQRYRHIADYDTLMSACGQAVCHAIANYDPTKGRSLNAHVIHRCRAACWRVVEQTLMNREHGRDYQDPDRSESNHPHYEDRPAPSIAPGIEDLPTFRRLSPEQQDMVRDYCQYGSMKATARRFRVTRQRVHQFLTTFVQRSRELVA